MTDAEALRGEIRFLLSRFSSGDLQRRRLEPALADKTVALCRAVVSERLDPGEEVRAEHHYAHAHLALHGSVLKEPDQEAVSLFATDKRLFYARLRLVFGRPVTCDAEDGTLIEELPYHSVAGLRMHRGIRVSEIVAGGLVVAFAVLFRPWLMVTGTLMAVLGALGILHGLLLPTRWAEIVPAGQDPASRPPLAIYALRRKSARDLIRFIRGRFDRPSAFR